MSGEVERNHHFMRNIGFFKNHKILTIFIIEAFPIVLSVVLFIAAISGNMLNKDFRHNMGLMSIYVGFSAMDLLIVTLIFFATVYQVISLKPSKFATNNEVDKIFSETYEKLWKEKIEFSTSGINDYVTKWGKIIDNIKKRVPPKNISTISFIIDMKSVQFSPLNILWNVLRNVILLSPILTLIVGHVLSYFQESIASVIAHVGWDVQGTRSFANTLSYFFIFCYVGEALISVLIWYLKIQHDKNVLKIIKDIFKFAAN
jgi:hypothetical protein